MANFDAMKRYRESCALKAREARALQIASVVADALELNEVETEEWNQRAVEVTKQAEIWDVVGFRDWWWPLDESWSGGCFRFRG